ncbi:hypothetical protein [Azohydromonas caseinilytica]|uniref:Uncharacterized protein n=1 Tax=Azohydromonas caseinilytica TaxID=2728836 RepID=A0A848FHT8_9BURK|nr:hypothetical protein [Azohydromonas caseinilytica]NML18822.1 hypothetical protein [Azohydromonas caseinilytica]
MAIHGWTPEAGAEAATAAGSASSEPPQATRPIERTALTAMASGVFLAKNRGCIVVSFELMEQALLTRPGAVTAKLNKTRHVSEDCTGSCRGNHRLKSKIIRISRYSAANLIKPLAPRQFTRAATLKSNTKFVRFDTFSVSNWDYPQPNLHTALISKASKTFDDCTAMAHHPVNFEKPRVPIERTSMPQGAK